MKYKIYKLIYKNDIIYVGSTKQKYLSQRKAVGYPNIPKDIWKNSDIILLEETDDKLREEYWIKYHINNGCILYNIRFILTDNELMNNKKESIKKSYQKNKHKYIKNINEWKTNNTDKVKEYSRKYAKKETRIEYQKEYQKKYREMNKSKQ